jgi:signal transduction histidine kinase
MEMIEQTAYLAADLGGAEHRRVEAVVETLAMVRSRGETLEEVAHDARNMVTALGLYCDLLEEPGVLTDSFLHYGGELRLVAAASRRLVEKLVALDCRATQPSLFADERNALAGSDAPIRRPNRSELGTRTSWAVEESRGWELLPALPIENLAEELAASKNLLGALAGPAISLTMEIEGAALPVMLTGEDLTRVLVNLVKNAAEAMPAGGHIELGLHEFHAGADNAPWLVLTVQDGGTGIPRAALDNVFEAGYTTRANASSSAGSRPGSHHGLGLSIARSILEAAGGCIRAGNSDLGGARFAIELPVWTK